MYRFDGLVYIHQLQVHKLAVSVPSVNGIKLFTVMAGVHGLHEVLLILSKLAVDVVELWSTTWIIVPIISHTRTHTRTQARTRARTHTCTHMRTHKHTYTHSQDENLTLKGLVTCLIFP